MDLRALGRRANDGAVTGVCWYSAEQWVRLREVAADPVVLEDTYEAWVAMMKKALRSLRDAGLTYQLVDVDTEELVRWCRRNGRPIDGAARAEYGAVLLRQRH